MAMIALLVEELTPADKVTAVYRRILRYFQAGIPLVWLVDHSERAVIVFRKGKGFEFFEQNEELTEGDMLPGVRCRVGDLLAPAELPTEREEPHAGNPEIEFPTSERTVTR